MGKSAVVNSLLLLVGSLFILGIGAATVSYSGNCSYGQYGVPISCQQLLNPFGILGIISGVIILLISLVLLIGLNVEVTIKRNMILVALLFSVLSWADYAGAFVGFFLVLMGGLGWRAVLSSSKKENSKTSGTDVTEGTLQILKKRYAEGEITKKQYDQMRKDLE